MSGQQTDASPLQLQRLEEYERLRPTMTHKEIAEHMGITPGALSVSLHWARKHRQPGRDVVPAPLAPVPSQPRTPSPPPKPLPRQPRTVPSARPRRLAPPAYQDGQHVGLTVTRDELMMLLTVLQEIEADHELITRFCRSGSHRRGLGRAASRLEAAAREQLEPNPSARPRGGVSG